MMQEEISLLRTRLNALLDRNRHLETENLQLKKQIKLLTEQPCKNLQPISFPKPHEVLLLPREPKIKDQPRKPKPPPNPSEFLKTQNAKRQDGLKSSSLPPPNPSEFLKTQNTKRQDCLNSPLPPPNPSEFLKTQNAKRQDCLNSPLPPPNPSEFLKTQNAKRQDCLNSPLPPPNPSEFLKTQNAKRQDCLNSPLPPPNPSEFLKTQNAKRQDCLNSPLPPPNPSEFLKTQNAKRQDCLNSPLPPPNPSEFLKPHNAKRKDGLNSSSLPPPPPPPPPPLKSQSGPHKAVQRVPDLVELYRVLTKREGKVDGKSGVVMIQTAGSSREMIGEIENRSAHVLAIKSAVETQGGFINFLAKEVENAACKDIADVESFVKWLDEELSYLVDERAVLKHFNTWPERKADAMREAACTYRDLKSLETEILSFRDDVRVGSDAALKRIQALQAKLEQCIHNIERLRESTSKRYRDFKIPWEWMLDTGFVGQIKLGSMKLVRAYMSRVVSSLKSEQFSDCEDLILNGVRFAFRVHQFVGGFDEASRAAFQELKMLVVKSPLLA